MEFDKKEIEKALEDIREMKNIIERGLPKLRKIFLTPRFGWLCISQAIFFPAIMLIYSFFKHSDKANIILVIAILLDCIIAGKWKLDIFRRGAKDEEYDGNILSFFKLPFLKELLNVGYILVLNTLAIAILAAIRMDSLWLIYPLLFSGIGTTFLCYGSALKSYSYKITGIIGMIISFVSIMLYNGNMEFWIAGGIFLLFISCGLSILREGKN